MMFHQPRSLPVFDMPPLPQWTFNTTAHWGLAIEGDEQIRRIKEIKGPQYLPSFHRHTQQSYFVDIFLTKDEALDWQASTTEDWIKLSSTEGRLDPESGLLQQRIWVSIDWDKAPASGRPRGQVRIGSSDKQHSLQVYMNNPATNPKTGQHIFAEDRGSISIYAENYSRLHNSEALDPGVIIDRILIERKGALSSYSPLTETRIK